MSTLLGFDVTVHIAISGSEKGICEGIEKALYTMKKREKAELKIQARYGFGEKGKEEFGIPSGADVVYEVYLTSFENPMESYEMDLDEKMDASQKVKEKGTSFFKVILPVSPCLGIF